MLLWMREVHFLSVLKGRKCCGINHNQHIFLQCDCILISGRICRVFQSHAAALENYRGRGGFKTWPEAWLNAYVQHAFVPQGDQVQLACAPEWESTTFAHTEHNPWPGIRQLRCPVIALAAERGSTFSPKAQKRLKALLPSADVRVLEGTTHFLPMEQKDIVRDAIPQLALSGCREN